MSKASRVAPHQGRAHAPRSSDSWSSVRTSLNAIVRLVPSQAAALAAARDAFVGRYCDLASEALRSNIETYETLTLARHIGLSVAIPGRSHCTDALVPLCEERLGGVTHEQARRGPHAARSQAPPGNALPPRLRLDSINETRDNRNSDKQ